MRLLSYNIRFGGTGREPKIAGVIRACDPDVVILQEATRPDVVQRIAAQCGMRQYGALEGHSVAYMARNEVSSAKWHRIPFARRHYLELALPPHGNRVFGVHLSAIHSNVTEQRRIWEAGSIVRSIAAQTKDFHIITGDFNTVGPGERLNVSSLPLRLRLIIWLTGRRIRWRTIQLMIEAGYIDGYRFLHPAGDAFTFPTWDPHVRLDYVFLPHASASRLKRCEVVREAAGVRDASDHFPLLSEIADV